MRRTFLTKGVLLAVLVVLVDVIFAPSAEARLFGGGFFRGRSTFGRRQWSMQPRQSCCRSHRNNHQNYNFTEVRDFDKLLQSGNQLFERNSFGQIRRLHIDHTGRLHGATELETVSQMVSFLALDRAGRFFPSRNNDRFLYRYGGMSNGQFIINMNVATFKKNDEDLLGATDDQIALATLNFLLNDMSQCSKLIRLDAMTDPVRKEVGLDLVNNRNLPECFRQDALNLMAQADPLSACTGGRIRLNALVKFLTNTKNYYRMIQASKTKDGFAHDYKIARRKEQSWQNKMLVMGKNPNKIESGVVLHNQRVVEFQHNNRFKVRSTDGGWRWGYCYGSYDVFSDKDHRATQNSDVRSKGVLFAHDAEEWLCEKPNGFSFNRYLFNNDKGGQLIENPTTNVVKKNINSGLTCLECHNNPIQGGGQKMQESEPGKFYHDNYADPNPETGERSPIPTHHRQFFTSNANYRALGDVVSRDMLQQQKNANAYIEYSQPGKGFKNQPFPLLPRSVAKFDEPLTEVEAARELGLPDDAFKGRFSGPGFPPLEKVEAEGKKTTYENAISRSVFESQACNLRAQALGAGGGGGAYPHNQTANPYEQQRHYR